MLLREDKVPAAALILPCSQKSCGQPGQDPEKAQGEEG
jgi:hypothetical protein